MPLKSTGVQLHAPHKLRNRNKRLARLGASTLRKYAGTKHKGLPMTANSRKSMKRRMRDY